MCGEVSKDIEMVFIELLPFVGILLAPQELLVFLSHLHLLAPNCELEVGNLLVFHIWN